MSARHARLRLRYRPASDVLSGEIELGTLAADHPTVDEPDADLHIEWRPGLDLDGLMLSAFQVVHASALVESESMRRLPPEVVNLARQLIASGRGTLRPGASAIEQVQARADSEAHLTTTQLLRPTTAPDIVPPRSTRTPSRAPQRPLIQTRFTKLARYAPMSPPSIDNFGWLAAESSTSEPRQPDASALDATFLAALHDSLPDDAVRDLQRNNLLDSDDDELDADDLLDAGDVLDAIDAANVAAALERVATAIAQVGSADDLNRSDQLVRLLRELAAVLSDEPGITSPGTSAAARRAARGGLGLSNSERARLRWALTALDSPITWQPAITELESLAEQLGTLRPTAAPRPPKPSPPRSTPRRTPRSPGHRSPPDGAGE